MRTFHLSVTTLSLILLLALFSCKRKTDTAEKKSGSRVITDMAGRKVTLPDSVHSAYIDRYSVQLVYAFDTVIPVNRVFNYNDSEKKYLKKSFYEGKPYSIDDDVEQIVKLKPEVMLLSRPLSRENIAEINDLELKTKIPIVLLDVDFKKYKETLAVLGRVLHKESKAEELIGFIRKYVDPVLEKGGKRRDTEKKKIYYAEGMKGFNTDPSGSIHSLIIDLVGAKNVAQTNLLGAKGMTAVSPEQIYLWNPDLVLVWSGNFDSMDSYKNVRSSPQWSKLKAVQEGHVYQVPWKPFGWIDRPPGINRLIGLVWLSRLLYPEDHPSGIKAIAKEYFQKYYHYKMNDSEISEIMNPQPNP